MPSGMPNLFVACECDADKNTIHSAACLTGQYCEPLSHAVLSRKGCSDMLSAGMAAFEAGCLLARQAGFHKIILRAPAIVEDEFRAHVAKDAGMDLDEDGGADYFGSGVYVYRSGYIAGLEPWQAAAWAKTRSMAAGARSAGL